eukprot:505562-Hanusia_phi.AAC.1
MITNDDRMTAGPARSDRILQRADRTVPGLHARTRTQVSHVELRSDVAWADTDHNDRISDTTVQPP